MACEIVAEEMTRFTRNKGEEMFEVVAKSTKEVALLMKEDVANQKHIDDNRHGNAMKQLLQQDSTRKMELEMQHSNDDNRHGNAMTQLQQQESTRKMELEMQLQIEQTKKGIVFQPEPQLQYPGTPLRKQAPSNLVAPSTAKRGRPKTAGEATPARKATSTKRQKLGGTPMPSRGRSNFQTIATMKDMGIAFPSGERFGIGSRLVGRCPLGMSFEAAGGQKSLAVEGVEGGYRYLYLQCKCWDMAKKQTGQAPEYCAKVRYVQVPVRPDR